ncbi:quinoprotein glucose dehydrogenase [Povalibacter uvarum]|uniref:Quinoprotein glucose dehydrogenase n=1 Tax=Povalibacter uvarum TaxID=732238 RepID=A0A841HMT3_9GAMM|nr:PQQ-binding-like beta-propeller repeat protein [Povalibacter uvarum]MBB6093488.1 quinoprotein glucose dehydrogenase [Povalibacter uvarum]
MKKTIRLRSRIGPLSIAVACCALHSVASSGEDAATTSPTYDATRWSYWGGDAGQTRYAPLNQISADNVRRLRIAWRWSADTSSTGASNNFKSTPLLDDGVLYVPWLNHGVAAIDAGTGRTLWTFEPQPSDIGNGTGSLNSRALAFWSDGREKRLIHNTLDGRLISIDARTGRADPRFGRNGWINLRDNLDDMRPRVDVRSVSPAIVVGDVIVAQSLPRETFKKEATPGNFRGFDVRTGKQLWTFHVVPRPGEVGNETWESDSWRWGGNAGTWTMMSADPKLGYVYIPTDTPANDFAGVDRPGDNLFAESILVLDARTGKRVWHFQTVHHGLWDYDNPAAPILHDIVRDRQRIPVATLLTKQNLVFTFNRVTGEPIWPIHERPVPQSTVPGEKTSPTQPFPSKPAPLSFLGYDENQLIDFTPQLRAEAVEIMKRYAKGPLFLPPVVAGENGLRGTWINPGYGGGAEWIGGAFDPDTGVLYVPIRHKPYAAAVAKADPARTNYSYLPSGNHVVTGPQGLPILQPPYSELIALDMNRGEHLWRIPIGGASDFIRNHPALKDLKLDFDRMGQYDIRPGLVLTKELIFMGESGSLPGQTGGPILRVYDKRDGTVLWQESMPALVTGAPMTYMHRGRQYVVLTVSQNGRPAEMIALTLDGNSENGTPPVTGVTAQAAPVSATITAAAAAVSAEDLALGGQVFGRVCSACHGATGQGGVGPSLTGRSDLANVALIIAEGQGQMPALAAALSANEVDAVAKYVVRALRPSAARAPSAGPAMPPPEG